MAKHPHYDLIVAWAEDTSRVVQYESKSDGEWIDEPEPKFHQSWNWRFKPEPKPDVTQNWFISNKLAIVEPNYCVPLKAPNLKLTFDGETGKLKAAEVIND